MTARSYTVGELRTRAQTATNHENDEFISIAEGNEQLSVAYGDLWEKLIDSGLGYFAQVSVSWTTDGVTGTKAFATGVGRIIAVERSVSSTRWDPVDVMHPRELADYGTTGSYARAYYLDGDNIQLVPIPSAGRTYRYRYYAAPAKFTASSDATTVDGISGWEDYLSARLELYIKSKEEADIRPYLAKVQAIEKRIEKARMDRIMFSPGRVKDTDCDTFPDRPPDPFDADVYDI